MKIGFIDYYLDEWHANTYPRMIREATGGEMEVAYAYAMIDSPLKGGRTTAQWSKDFGIPCLATIEELVEKSDAIVVLSPDNCEMHEELCQIPLRSGKRTYIDKTFAPDAEVGGRIFAIAEEYGTPCYSTSALRFASEYAELDPDQVRAIASWGPGSFETYIIHQLEPICMLMKAEVKRLMALPGEDWLAMTLLFTDGRLATTVSSAKGGPFAMNVGLESGHKNFEVKSDFFGAFIQALIAFFKTGEAPVKHEETMRIMRVRGAGVKAMAQPFTWVEV